MPDVSCSDLTLACLAGGPVLRGAETLRLLALNPETFPVKVQRGQGARGAARPLQLQQWQYRVTQHRVTEGRARQTREDR